MKAGWVIACTVVLLCSIYRVSGLSCWMCRNGASSFDLCDAKKEVENCTAELTKCAKFSFMLNGSRLYAKSCTYNSYCLSEDTFCANLRLDGSDCRVQCCDTELCNYQVGFASSSVSLSVTSPMSPSVSSSVSPSPSVSSSMSPSVSSSVSLSPSVSSSVSPSPSLSSSMSLSKGSLPVWLTHSLNVQPSPVSSSQYSFSTSTVMTELNGGNSGRREDDDFCDWSDATLFRINALTIFICVFASLIIINI